jgi:putative ABC transport system permease protein
VRVFTPESFAECRRILGSRMLWRKLGADMRALSHQTLVLMVLVCLGIALFVGLYEAYQNVTGIYDTIYRTTRMADASVQFDLGPPSLAERARALPHVREVTGRLSKDGAIIQRGRERERVIGRFIAVPPAGKATVNDLWVVAGRSVQSPREAVLEQQFAKDNGYAVGDTIKCSYQSTERELTIVGLAASPEYIYPVPSRHALFIARGTFGVVFISQQRAEEWFGKGTQINEVHCLTDPGHQAEVVEKLEALAKPYGVRFAYVQDEQPSKKLLTMDQQGLATMSVFFPVMFLGAAGLSLYGALLRIVRLQMPVIGTLRACGFSRGEVLTQYGLQGVLIPLGGAIPGLIFGHLMAVGLNRLYAGVLRLPITSAAVHWDTMVVGLVIALATGLVAAFVPARLASKVPPAMAMRGDLESRGRAALRPFFEPWIQRVAVFYRIPLRGIQRRASRTLFAVGGVASGTIIMVTTLGQYVSTLDAIDEFLTGTRKYEIDVQLTGPESVVVARAAAQAPGGGAVAPTVSVPVRVRSSRGQGELILTGLQAGQDLLHVRTVSGGRMTLRPGVIWLPRRLAERLHIEPGDPVQVEWEGSSRRLRLRREMRLAGLLDVTMGNSAYGEYKDVRRSLADRAWPESSFGALFDCARERSEAFRRRLERSDGVVAAITTADVSRDIDQQMAMTYIFIGVLLGFGTLLAGSALQSVATVTLLERTRELATLRSLGFTASATSWLAGIELFLLAAVGLVLGLPLGAEINAAFLKSYTTENLAFRAILPPWVFVVIILLVMALVLLSVWTGGRRLARMSLPEATKARE